MKNSTYPNLPLWLGESADASFQGTENVSDRFVGTFLWMDKLGLSASMGIRVVMRQSIFGEFYGMLNATFDPNPDYWVSVLHKKLVGTKVLDVCKYYIMSIIDLSLFTWFPQSLTTCHFLCVCALQFLLFAFNSKLFFLLRFFLLNSLYGFLY